MSCRICHDQMYSTNYQKSSLRLDTELNWLKMIKNRRQTKQKYKIKTCLYHITFYVNESIDVNENRIHFRTNQNKKIKLQKTFKQKNKTKTGTKYCFPTKKTKKQNCVKKKTRKKTKTKIANQISDQRKNKTTKQTKKRKKHAKQNIKLPVIL